MFVVKGLFIVILLFAGAATSDKVESAWPIAAAVAVSFVLALTHKEEPNHDTDANEG